MSTDFGKRLKIARKHANLSQVQLAKAIGISQSSVAHLETEGHGSSHVHQIAMTCGVSTQWLSTGDGTMLTELALALKAISPNSSDVFHAVHEPRADYNVTPELKTKSVPVVSWVQAGEFSDASDPYPVGTSDEWIECPAKHGPRTFAVKVRGLSMYNPAGKPSFSEGDIIFCDPDRQPENKSLVICRLDDQPEATFKRLLIEDGIKMLEALNPSWPQRIITINGNATICGVVFGRYDSF